ncbi:Selenoprotein M [Merluccius polli]|uniref:Selenoprotein M n=1 Tax=Merluccius polli TaxID=89951 RepID=A0AA47MXK9_MERPO|nr:Selenoprotein M [Merluccius polli]
MWASFILLLALSAHASESDSGASVEEKPVIARGKLLGFPGFPNLWLRTPLRVRLTRTRGHGRLQTPNHNLEYDSSEEKNPRLIFYDEKGEVVQTVPVKKMKADAISQLLDGLGFYKRSQKGEEVPERFQRFPLGAPRDEL